MAGIPSVISRLLAVLLVMVAVAGCAFTRERDGVKTTYFLGLGRVVTPVQFVRGEPLVITDVTVFGLNADGGLGLGYFHTSRVSVPIDCRVYVRVGTRDQLDTLISTLNESAKEGVCVCVDP